MNGKLCGFVNINEVFINIYIYIFIQYIHSYLHYINTFIRTFSLSKQVPFGPEKRGSSVLDDLTGLMV